MKKIDLTHTIYTEMPLYPGTEKPEIESLGPEAEDGFRIKWFRLQSHMGTHMDAPYHYFHTGRKIADFLPDELIGNAFICDVTKIRQQIEKSFLEQHEAALKECQIVVFKSGWSRYYGTPAYFENYPVLSEEAALYLMSLEIKGIGIDAPSIDVVETEIYPIHQIVLGSDKYVLENLTNLESVTADKVQLIALPLKLKEADGAPVRVVAVE